MPQQGGEATVTLGSCSAWANCPSPPVPCTVHLNLPLNEVQRAGRSGPPKATSLQSHALRVYTIRGLIESRCSGNTIEGHLFLRIRCSRQSSVVFLLHQIDAVLEPMEEAADTQDGDPMDKDITQAAPSVVNIAPNGDVVLDVEFQNSRETLKSARKATASQVRPTSVSSVPQPELKLRVKVAYRVRLATLKLHSKYFENLLSDTRFQEARSIETAFEKLSLKGVRAEDAEAQELPWVKIVDDDEATRSAGREAAFGDLLRILHHVDTVTKSFTFNYVATLAVLADRFDCVLAVSRYMPRLKPKWPLTQPRSPRDDGVGLTQHTEEVLRQKILVAWLLDQPLRLAAASRELIMYGSARWSAFPEADMHAYGATWWDLQDDLESKYISSSCS